MDYIKLINKVISKKKSHLVIGLDPELSKIPAFIKKFRNPVFEFCRFIIESTYSLTAGYKFNVAFFESSGWKGVKTLEELIKFKPNNTIFICDAKRGDIGNTSEHYAKAYLDLMDFDAITASPYMGLDSVEPFLLRNEKGVYILALTSNQGANDFQILKSGNKHLYEIVIDKFLKSGYNNIGFVVGANNLKIIKKITEKSSVLPLLIPGVGAQGGKPEKLLNNLKNRYFLINSSRAIIYSGKYNEKEEEYRKKVIFECEKFNNVIKPLK